MTIKVFIKEYFLARFDFNILIITHIINDNQATQISYLRYQRIRRSFSCSASNHVSCQQYQGQQPGVTFCKSA